MTSHGTLDHFALVVEDDPLWATILSETVARKVSRVETTTTFQDAEAVVQRGLPDLLVIDVGLGAENGLDLVEAVRRRDTRMPIVVVTGDTTRESAIRAINLGVTRFISKQATIPELEQLFDDVLAGFLLKEERQLHDQFFHEVIQNSSDHVLVLDEHQIVQFCNLPATEGTHAGRSLVVPDDTETWNTAFARALQNPGTVQATLVRTTFGTEEPPENHQGHRWIDARIRSMVDHPAVRGVVVNARDVTEEREVRLRLERAERELSQRVARQEFQFSTLFELLPLGVIILDGEDRFLQHNRAAAEILDLEDQRRDHSWRTARSPLWSIRNLRGTPVPWEELPSTLCRRRRETVYNHILGLAPDQWLRVSATPLEEGHVMLVFQEISEEIRHARTDARLRRRLERTSENLRFLTSWLSEVAAWDDAGRSAEHILAALEMPPFLHSAALYRHREGDTEATGQPILGTLEWPATFPVPAAPHLPDPREPWLLQTGPPAGRVLVHPLPARGDTLQYLVCRSRGGYDRRARAMCASLAHVCSILLEKERIRQERLRLLRTQRRQEQYLARAERLAALGSLTSAIGHEINQPLQSIKIIADSSLFWMEKHNAAPDMESTRDALTRISDRADWAARIVRGMKTVFQNPGEITVDEVELEPVIRKSIEICRNLQVAAGIATEVELDETMPTFPFAEVQLKQVLVNLLKNAYGALARTAADHHRENPRVLIRTRRVDGARRMEILDNGPGIPEKLREKVFDPFYTTQERPEGMGLGLYVVHTISRAMQCTVHIEGAPEGGACIVIQEG